MQIHFSPFKKGMLIFALAAGLTACSHPDQPSADASLTKTTQVRTLRVPNPATVYCIKQKGTIEIRNESKGQITYCHLPDGTVTEQWTLFRQNNPDQAAAGASK